MATGVRGLRFLEVLLLSGLSTAIFAQDRIVGVEAPNLSKWERQDLGDRLRPLIEKGWRDGDEVDWATWLRESGVFENIQVRPQRENEGVRVWVDVQAKRRIGTIEFVGNRALGVQRLRRVFRLTEGQRFEPDALHLARERILKVYAEEGFPAAQVHVVTEPMDDRFVQLRVLIVEGAEESIRSITWSGDWPAAMTRFVKLAKLGIGKRWTRKLRESARRSLEGHLIRLGYLSAVVKVEGERLPGGGVHVTADVKLGPLYEVAFVGNKALSEKRLRAIFEGKRRRVVGRGLWEELRNLIREEYEKEGYWGAEVRYEIEDIGTWKRRVTFRIREGPPLRLCEVRFVGVTQVSQKRLRREMEQVRRRWAFWKSASVTSAAVDEGLRRVRLVYRRAGFVKAEVTDRHVILDWERRCVDIIVFVSEGSRVRIGGIDLVGWPSEVLHPPRLVSRVGQPLDEDILEGDRIRLQQGLVEAGYWSATVEKKWRTRKDDSGMAEVAFIVDPGVRASVDRVLVAGNFETRTRTLVRAIGLQRGKPVTPGSLTRARERLLALGVFRSAEVFGESLEDADAGSSESASGDTGQPREGSFSLVRVLVDERPRYSLAAGAGYNTRDGFRAFGEVADQNVAHRAVRVSLRGDVAIDPQDQSLPNEYLADLGIRFPQAFGADWAFRSNLLAQRSTRSIDQFSIERVASISAVEWRGVRGLVTGLELQGELARIFDIRPDVRNFNPDDEGRLVSIGLGPFLLYDRRDDPFLPTRGWSQTWRFRFVPDVPGMDVPLVKAQWVHSHYQPLRDGWTLVVGLRAGWARTLNGKIVPLRERFFIGGRSTVRGFSENSIGPAGAPIIDPYGNVLFRGRSPLGGDVLLNSSVEFRFPLFGGASGVVFGDGGGVYFQDRRIDWSGYRRSAGFGVLYPTPVGPLALHWGFKLDRRKGEDAGAVHFSIGAAF